MAARPGEAPIRELSRGEIDALLDDELVGRIGCHADGLTYVVPVIYAYDGDAFYVASREGQKVRMMRANPEVCFEVDRYERGSWRSAIAHGRFEELAGEEAARAIHLLAARFPAAPLGGGAGSGRSAGEGTVCFRIRIGELTGRAVDRNTPVG
jgi:nitroimidazol reductase NimA-like FMN-containing flavoprotein (pyridoxamine 5'-phosphate oxidase superfamily)